MGTTTDKDGFYSMKPIPAGRYELVISMIGYKMERQDLIIYDNDRIALNFRLEPEPIQMAEITVTYKKDKKWQKDYTLFKRAFLGTSMNGEECTILNEYVLSFDRKSGLLMAKASQPLKIENKRLGYEITYYLDEFELDDVYVRYAGDSFFKEMQPRSQRELDRWVKYRRVAYNGSIRHFLNTLGERFDLRYKMDGDSLVEHVDWVNMSRRRGKDPLMIEGFDIYVVKPGKSGNINAHFRLMNKQDEIVYPGDRPDELKLSFEKRLKVIYRRESEENNYNKDLIKLRAYPFQESYILLNKDMVVFDKSGRYFETYMIEQRGYMGWERFGDKLPFNYKRPE